MTTESVGVPEAQDRLIGDLHGVAQLFLYFRDPEDGRYYILAANRAPEKYAAANMVGPAPIGGMRDKIKGTEKQESAAAAIGREADEEVLGLHTDDIVSEDDKAIHRIFQDAIGRMFPVYESVTAPAKKGWYFTHDVFMAAPVYDEAEIALLKSHIQKRNSTLAAMREATAEITSHDDCLHEISHFSFIPVVQAADEIAAGKKLYSSHVETYAVQKIVEMLQAATKTGLYHKLVADAASVPLDELVDASIPVAGKDLRFAQKGDDGKLWLTVTARTDDGVLHHTNDVYPFSADGVHVPADRIDEFFDVVSGDVNNGGAYCLRRPDGDRMIPLPLPAGIVIAGGTSMAGDHIMLRKEPYGYRPELVPFEVTLGMRLGPTVPVARAHAGAQSAPTN